MERGEKKKGRGAKTNAHIGSEKPQEGRRRKADKGEGGTVVKRAGEREEIRREN